MIIVIYSLIYCAIQRAITRVRKCSFVFIQNEDCFIESYKREREQTRI